MSARITPGRLRRLGPVNWAVWKVVSLVSGTPDAHLFSTLGRAGGTYRGWLHFGATFLRPGGRISRHETELVILRVAHLRGCDYEMDHHARLGRRAGVTPGHLARVLSGPDAPGWSPRHRALLAGVDDLITTKNLAEGTWSALAAHLDERGLIEFVLLVGQYDMLATTIDTLRIERDTFR
ncbi:carboxymuconolactone decarboxylase family protein [Rhodococcus sp. NPDC003318]|uniref:carboxymuconolactone decarboxylase family protein n=1 Tax=Rhodococcus sp. NPDC003318 TaxID=3364503 RepID=UPI0036CF3B11